MFFKIMKLFILDITYFPGFVQSFLVSNFLERFDAAGIRGFGGVLVWAKTRASGASVSTIDEIPVHQAKGFLGCGLGMDTARQLQRGRMRPNMQ